jgi:hypothetical protein
MFKKSKTQVFKSVLLLALLTLNLNSRAQNLFEGIIHYKMNYTDMQGNDINKKMAAFFDMEQYMYFSGSNYKVLNASGSHLKLYQGKNNAYFFFNRDNSAYKIDQTSKTAQWVKVIETKDVDTILGYPCKSVKIDADFRAYIYFYNEDIKIDPAPYKNYNLEAFNAYMEASNGALPLKVIMIDIRSKFIEEKTAVSIEKKKLTPEEFDFPSGSKLRKLKYGIDLIW